MASVLTTDEWKKRRASMERWTMERQRIRWLAGLIILAVFGLLGWYFGWLRAAPPLLAPVTVSIVLL